MAGRLIRELTAWMVFDSRGQPTVCARIACEQHSAQALVPSGASTGQFEAHELRDGGQLFAGKGVEQAIANITQKIAPVLVGMELDPLKLDEAMLDIDGTEQKQHLGANAILAVSMAAWRLYAIVLQKPLYQVLQTVTDVTMPVPMLNVINGGAHASNCLDVQEFMIVPHGFSRMKDALGAAFDITQALKCDLKGRGASVAVGDEGGFAPDCFKSSEQVIEYLAGIIDRQGLSSEVSIALDVAASEFYDPNNQRYVLSGENKTYDNASWTEQVASWITQFPITSVEDPFADVDAPSWRALTHKHGASCMIVGDDIFVTQEKRLQVGIDEGLANAVLIKLNQVGSVSETLRCIDLARKNGLSYIISHRSGDTEDAWISDLAVATGAGYIKTGALCRSERVAKYNRLLDIEMNQGA